jgi:UDP-2,3-diacylglucosamine pyrophosphatase LpxH
MRMYRKKFDYIRSMIQPADRVFILGDFWDGFLTPFDKFLDSGWNKLFPLLRQRQAVYLYGNHDRPQWCDERANLFSVEQTMEYRLQVGDKQLYLTHGHTVFTSLEDKFPVLNHSLPLRVGASMDILHKLVWGRRFLNTDSSINNTARKWVAERLPQPEILICGHSHYPEIDLEHRFINTGFIGSGFGNYITIEDDQISAVRQRY